VRNWLDGRKPTVEAESHFLEVKRDLLSIFPGAKPPANNILETFIEDKCSSLFSTKASDFYSVHQGTIGG
jgi:hypothetical protein